MIDFEFKTGLVTNRFPGYNLYHYDTLHDSDILLLNPKLVPIIKLQGSMTSPKEPSEILQYSDITQFRGRALNREKVAEILNGADYPIFLKITNVWFFIGKGFIALKDIFTGKLKPIMVACVPEVNYRDQQLVDITLLVDNTYKEQVAIIKSLITFCMTTCIGDVIMTNNIIKHLSGKLKLPKFSNIRARREFIQTFVEQCVAAF